MLRRKGFLPDAIYNEIDGFNEKRRRAIHKLATGTVTRSELAQAAQSATPIYGAIQNLWLTTTIGPEQRVGE